MHRLLLPPTGWGFMLTHDWRCRGAMVVTDGGSYSACYRVTLGTIGGFLGHGVKPRGGWAWVLSHMDYDHYSITVGLIKARLWPKPKLMILPAVYSSRVCREALAEYHRLALLEAAILRAPPPATIDLVRVAGSVKRVGARQGTKLYAGGLVYHIIWPPTSGTWPSCEELLEKLRKKLDKAMNKCRETRGREVCKEVVARGEREAGELLESLAPEEIVETLDLDRELETGSTEGAEPDREEGSGWPGRWLRAVWWWAEAEHPTYEYIYVKAAEELRDPELLQLHRDIVNNFSLAYTLEYEEHLRNRARTALVRVEPPYSRTQTTRYYESAPSTTLLFYPSDLGEDALARAINYYIL